MARTKKRSKAPFIGRRKKTTMQRYKSELKDLNVCVASKEVSASETKLRCFGLTLEDLMKLKESRPQEENTASDSFVLVQVASIAKLFMSLQCPNCKQSNLRFNLSNEGSLGFSTIGKVDCSSCNETVSETFLCERSDRSESSKVPFEVNTRAVLAFRGIGCGFSAIKEWCSIMNLPYFLSQNGYNKINTKLNEASKSTFSEIREQSLGAIKAAYNEVGVVPDGNGILDVAVSFDGAWQKRGHSSHNGMASVIDLLTGLPLDHEVLCNFCHKCAIAADQPPNPEWEAKHRLNCPKNYNGSSNSMEVECALHLWRRSQTKNSMRYTTILCDGDSKAFDSIVAEKVYGDDVIINKEDCVNHVSKRMGTALRNLVTKAKAQKESISGKGKLTQEKIVKIQNYYGRAIKDNSDDIDLMRKRIFAILFHMSSTDDHPKHVHCPPGAKSWCFWQKAEAQSKEPGPHKDHETVGAEVGKKLVPIFQRLADKELLKRCARKMTQNANESLHNLIWKLCPKAIFVGRKTMETAVALASCQFSIGAGFREILCRVLGIQPGAYLIQSSIDKNIERIKMGVKKSSKKWKGRRRQIKFGKTKQSSKKASTEGKTYAAGAF